MNNPRVRELNNFYSPWTWAFRFSMADLTVDEVSGNTKDHRLN
jgi:hypothetical protein